MKYFELPKNTLINIYTDSEFCYNALSSYSHPHYNQYYIIINSMYDKISQFHKNVIFFEIHHIKAHQQNNNDKNVKYNNIADELAKAKIDETKIV